MLKPHVIPYFWIAVCLLLICTEAILRRRITICFLPGTCVCLFLSFTDISFWKQAICFFAIASIFLVGFYLSKRRRRHRHIGARAVVTERIPANGRGIVRMYAKQYTAICAVPEESFDVGEIVLVQAITANGIAICGTYSKTVLHLKRRYKKNNHRI